MTAGAEDKQIRSEYATPDLACTRCRERKIRCGRERPECRNCEREGGVTCVYQTPTKRVNHIKLLCDSFNQLQGRLSSMETNIARLAAGTNLGDDIDNGSSCDSSLKSKNRQHNSDDEAIDDESQSDTEDATELHVFRNKVDMADRYYGPSSLFVLCKRFRTQFLDASKSIQPGIPMDDLLHNLCETAGVLEPFPFQIDQFLLQPVPKQQALTAVGHFLQHLDIRTDIFSQSSLLRNLERVYSKQPKPGDDAWVTCFKVITLLVLGMELSVQARNALFGDFARSFLPSRAALVTSSLLSTPRLINVQTLILLSVAMQQFDPPGWAELMFTHACILARTMGLQHVQMLWTDPSAEEQLERSKVLSSLYAHDKSLCITNGSVSWLPTNDGKLAVQLRAAIDRRDPYSGRIQLAMIQDQIYRLTNATCRRDSVSNSKSQAAVKRVERQLSEHTIAFGIFEYEVPYYPRHAMLVLEFLATRIIALQHSAEPEHATQVRRDARASCLLLLIAHGDQDHEAVEAYNTLVSSAATRKKSASSIVAEAIPFGSFFDSFSVPAFFILLEDLLQPTDDQDAAQYNADLELLQKVSTCYNLRTGQMQSNSYHRKVSRVFEYLLVLLDTLKKAKQNPSDSVSSSVPVAEMVPPHLPLHMSPFQSDMTDFSTLPMGSAAPGQVSSFPHLPSPCTPSSWDNWLTMPSTMMSATPFGTSKLSDFPVTDMPDLLAQMLGTSQSLSDSSAHQSQWSTSDTGSTSGRKRRRTGEDIGEHVEGSDLSPLSDFLVTGE